MILVDVKPSERARAQRIIGKVGEPEFRGAVERMTGWNIASFSLDDVVCVYVLALQGRVRPPEMGRAAAERHMTLPPRTADDAGFSDAEGRRISRAEWLRQRVERLGRPEVA